MAGSSPTIIPADWVTAPGTAAAVEASIAEVDHGFDENDSAYADEKSAYTASLTSNVKNHTYENGRRYASYQSTGSVSGYMAPNDQAEADRLDMHHHLGGLLVGGKLITAPFEESPKRILDVGTGTGLWANEAGDRYPSAETLGVDISPTQPSMIPPNVQFETDDVEQEWTYNEPFDYIHSRFIGGSIRDWPRYIGSDNTIPKDSLVLNWHNLIYKAMGIVGVSYMPGGSIK